LQPDDKLLDDELVYEGYADADPKGAEIGGDWFWADSTGGRPSHSLPPHVERLATCAVGV
jgi:hypothetical protein